MNRVTLDGIEYPVDGLENFVATYGLNEENNTFDYTTARNLTFYGEGMEYLKSVFFGGDCERINQTVKAGVYLCGCGVQLDFIITYEGVIWCDDECTVSVDLERLTEASKCYRYFDSTIYWKNGFIAAFEHPKVYYCTQPGFGQYAAFFLQASLGWIILTLQAIVAVIKTLCEIVTIGFGNCDLGPIENISICSVYEFIGGCGKKVPSPLIRNILEFQSEACGITFSSSIFQQPPYDNTALFQLQYERGYFGNVDWIAANAANLTVIQLLDQLSLVFNAEYRIIDGQLIFERKDYFDTLTTVISEGTGCYSFIQNNNYAFGRYTFAEDSVDQQGNRMRLEFDDIIEFNPENLESRRGEKTVAVPFGRSRFMFDQRTLERPDDIPGNTSDPEPFLGDRFIDRYRSTNVYNLFGCRDDRRERDLILTGDQASALKLLVLEQGFDPSDAFTVREQIATDGNQTFYKYNFPMYFAESEENGLWANFHIIDHPDSGNRQVYEVDQITIDLDCETEQLVREAEAGYTFLTPLGPATANAVEVNYGDRTIKATQLKIKCND